MFQCLSLLCRNNKVTCCHGTQVPDIDALLSQMFSDLQQHPEKAEGAGQLLFQMCKGLRNMFHSCTANVSFFTKRYFVLAKSVERSSILNQSNGSDFLHQILFDAADFNVKEAAFSQKVKPCIV